MILLDTNVLSELMRPAPASAVTRWVREQSASSLYITSITQAEILHGVMLLPKGRRRNTIETAAQAMFAEDFADRILPFDSDAAPLYAVIAAHRRKTGKPISQFDAQIAAVARRNGAWIATRNDADFDDCGIKVINPWKS